MNDTLKNWAYGFLALRVVIDLVLAIIMSYQTDSIGMGIAFMLMCGVFHLFLFFGIKNESFRGRYGRRVTVYEPVAYWFIVGFLVLFHGCVTVAMGGLIEW